jgi:hypothetical protein
MFMHNNNVDVEYATFDRIGRTDKSRVVTDPVAGSPASLDNPRGRYSVHFHRIGNGMLNEDPAVARGLVVTNSPGWGVVNHSSYVEVDDCVSYNITGAHFVTEIGDELGHFKRNLSVYSAGGGFAFTDNNRGNFDWGFQGHGFWIQGGGTVELSDNFASGHNHSSYIYMGLDASLYKIANLPDPSIWNGPNYWGGDHMPSQDVPIRFYRNTSVDSTTDLFTWAIHNPHYHTTDSAIEDSKFFGGGGVGFGYSGFQHFKNVAIINDVNFPVDSATSTTGAAVSGMTFENMHIEGWQAGINNPSTENGGFIDQPTRIIGGYFNNVASIVIYNTQQQRPRTILIDGTQRYGTLSPQALASTSWPGPYDPAQQWDIYMALWFFTWDIRGLERAAYAREMPVSKQMWLFDPANDNYAIAAADVIKLGDEFLSYAELDPQFSLSGWLNFPDDLRLKPDRTARTTAELAADKGLFVGGRELTGPVSHRARIRGVFHAEPPVFH